MIPFRTKPEGAVFVRAGGKDRVEVLEGKLLELAASQNRQHLEACAAQQAQEVRIGQIEYVVTNIAERQTDIGKSTSSLEQMMAQLAAGQLEIQRTCGGLAQAVETMRTDVVASLALVETGTSETSTGAKVRRIGY